jgi:hypothetical protein
MRFKFDFFLLSRWPEQLLSRWMFGMLASAGGGNFKEGLILSRLAQTATLDFIVELLGRAYDVLQLLAVAAKLVH